MAEYFETATGIVRREDGRMIATWDETDPATQEYQTWLDEGNVPDPYAAPFHVEPFDTGLTIAERLGVRT